MQDLVYQTYLLDESRQKICQHATQCHIDDRTSSFKDEYSRRLIRKISSHDKRDCDVNHSPPHAQNEPDPKDVGV